MNEPPGLGERGSAIWQAKAAGVVDPAALALVLEAARCADRLDELDSIIQGKGVLNLMQFRLNDIDYDSHEMSVTVSFAAPLAEARQQQQRLTSLLQAVASIAPAVAAPAPVEAEKPVSAVDELEARRARRAASRGK